MSSMVRPYRFDLCFFKKIALISVTLIVAGCAGVNDRSTQSYHVAADNAQTVEVIRDGRLVTGSSAEQDACPTVFYINNKDLGRYTIHQQATVYLDPDSYSLMAENCNGKSNSYSLKVTSDSASTVRQVVLSLDGHGRPLVIERIKRTH